MNIVSCSDKKPDAGVAANDAANPKPVKHIKDEIQGLVRLYSDGTAERLSAVVSEVPPLQSCSKDVTIDPSKGIWARIHISKAVLSDKKTAKVPILLYFHGGGFVMGSPAWSVYNNFLNRLVSHGVIEGGFIVVSVAYRLAPEHRLPAAYDDGFQVLMWLISGATCDWISRHGDTRRCVIAGDSAGGNIVHHVALRAMREPKMKKVVKGMVCIQPFFGTGGRNFDAGLPHEWINIFWRWSLPFPHGETKNHPWCNPLAEDRSAWATLPPVLVCVSDCDTLNDADVEYYVALKEKAKDVRLVTLKGVGHAFQLLQTDSPRVVELLNATCLFVRYCCVLPEAIAFRHAFGRLSIC